MKKVFIAVIEGLHYLVAGEGEEEPAFNQKLRIVLIWSSVIAFCLVMLKLFL